MQNAPACSHPLQTPEQEAKCNTAPNKSVHATSTMLWYIQQELWSECLGISRNNQGPGALSHFQSLPSFWIKASELERLLSVMIEFHVELQDKELQPDSTRVWFNLRRVRNSTRQGKGQSAMQLHYRPSQPNREMCSWAKSSEFSWNQPRVIIGLLLSRKHNLEKVNFLPQSTVPREECSNEPSTDNIAHQLEWRVILISLTNKNQVVR